MTWKDDLACKINMAVSRAENTTITISSIEQKEFGERYVDSIFSNVHLDKPIKIDFKVVYPSVSVVCEKIKQDEKISNVGRVIYGFCNGFFGRDSYDDKRIEAEGVDWIVARGIDSGFPEFTYFSSEEEKNTCIEKWSIKEE